MAWGSMFIVPPASGARRGPSAPQSSAARRAVPAPATTASRSGPASMAARRHRSRSPVSEAQTRASTPKRLTMASASAAASGETLPDARVITTSTLRTPPTRGSRPEGLVGGAAAGRRLRVAPRLAHGDARLADRLADDRFGLVGGHGQLLIDHLAAAAERTIPRGHGQHRAAGPGHDPDHQIAHRVAAPDPLLAPAVGAAAFVGGLQRAVARRIDVGRAGLGVSTESTPHHLRAQFSSCG